ncbi:class II fructose-bisphosphate aldolase [Streptomyces sulfonofaciens]|uniref:class II fructose-bisphosphate aldolase n=1 Tax=Streptomyces sulfonofaciens TaxID=68272 RepID=UPI001676A13B|nr:class II fructose-bisphosphate aldolase [Streptomyces sulfonofaciens]
MDDLLRQCPTGTLALPAFTCYNLEQAVAVIQAAESADRALCLLLAEKAFRGRAGEMLAATLVTLADRAHVPTCVQLDHVADLETMHKALDIGVTALMADGSKLTLQANTELVAQAVTLAERYDASVEAELGRIEGDEDQATGSMAGTMTNPAQAASFVKQTGAHALAIAIGNVHGTYTSPPILDWQRLDDIRATTSTHITLHGASGLKEGDLKKAITHGVVKININTELRRTFFETLTTATPVHAKGWNLLELSHSLTTAVRETAADLLSEAFSG